MGLFKIWKDHVTQYSNRYREVQNADGTITHEAVEGEVVQEGTPQNAQNFNDLEERILSAGLIANLAMLKLGAAESRIKGLRGEIVEATLTNTKSYPFNNSKKDPCTCYAKGQFGLYRKCRSGSKGRRRCRRNLHYR